MGNTRSGFKEDFVSYNLNSQQLMDELFLVVEDQDAAEHTSSYPMCLRQFPPSFWEHSIGNTSTKTCLNEQKPLNGSLESRFHKKSEPTKSTTYTRTPMKNEHPVLRASYSEPSDRHRVFHHYQRSANCTPCTTGSNNSIDETWASYNYTHLPGAYNNQNDDISETSSRDFNKVTIQHQNVLHSTEQEPFYDINTTFKSKATTSHGCFAHPYNPIPQKRRTSENSIQTDDTISNQLERSNSGFVQDWVTSQTSTTSATVTSDEVNNPFSNTPFLSQLYREMQIQNAPPNYSGQAEMNSTNTNIPVGFSASSLNTQNISNEDTPSYQKRLNDLEATCNSLQKELQLLRNKQSGLTGSQEDIQVVLNEVRDSLDPAEKDNEEGDKQNNGLSWTKKDTTTVGIPQQNNAFLTVPEISHTAQSSGDSGLGEFDLTAFLNTSPFGSSNDIHEASKMPPNSVPENAIKDETINNSYKNNKASSVISCNNGSVSDNNVVQEGQTPSQFQPDFMTDLYGFDMQL